MMEKRNVVEGGRTPASTKGADTTIKSAAAGFSRLDATDTNRQPERSTDARSSHGKGR